jgi:Skp family chaperone for outer membrane proteins
MERREEFVARHIEEIRAVVRTMAERTGSSIVLNTSGFEVLYSAPGLDITEKVIQELNGDR